ncbi:carboxypeptidase regulatory-like domain-containing protein [Ancylomarina longa]|uniref:Fibronectin type-III domain-containing protein n=1 Tax=Ancylomarina longa TaxID=2487017 RepID=A0A434AZI6_9BACT|nr:carboxypeptidase regulatory-like domain-containing protein [Ancylomarina longa]RUT80031.1 hypothetical protein DLK05_01355 [Ancylomarina longa]
MRKFYLLFRFLFLMTIFSLVFSCNENTIDPDQFGSISGTVKTSDGNLPMEGVAISTSPGSKSVTTDVDGHFNLGEVLVGDYSVTAKKEDYTSENVSIKVLVGQALVMDIVMQVAPPEFAAPEEPVYITPLNATVDLATSTELVWNAGETETGDTLRYDVIIFEGGDDFEGTKVASNILDTTYTVSGLKFETPYQWKIVARNRSLDETEGRLWKFKTEKYPSNPFFFVKDTLGSKDIYSWDLAENHLIRLTDDGGSEVSPRISPNEELLAFSSNVTGKYQIYTMDLKGNNVTKVTDLPIAGYQNNGSGFSWSPDGSQIAYANYSNLYKINYNGTGLQSIAKAPVNRQFKSCEWSGHFKNRSQEKIVALTQGELPYDNEIYLMDPDSSNMTLLVDNLPGTLSNPHFTITGDKVIFSLDSLYEDDQGQQFNAKIYSIDVDGSNLTDLSEDNKEAGTNDLQAVFSQTGGKIIFMNVANDGDGTKNIWTMDTDGQNREEIIKNAEMPEWINPK